MSNSLLSSENHLLQLAKQRNLRWPNKIRWAYPFAVLLYALLAPFVGQLIILVPLLIILALLGQPVDVLLNPTADSVTMSAVLVVSFVPVFAAVWLWLKLFERRPLWTVGLENYDGLRRYFRGLAVGLLMFSAAVGVMLLLGYTTVEPATAEPAVGPLLLGLAAIFVGWMIQGAAEEVLTRGFLLPILGLEWGLTAGVLVSSSLFALLHFLNPNVSLIAFLNLFLFGVFAALYALAERDLWGVFAIHSIWNWAQGNLFGYEVSGQAIGGATLFNFTETGPDLLTGGPFGPEGGLIVTAVLILGCIWVWWRHQRQRPTQIPTP